MPEENKAGQDLEHGRHRYAQADTEKRAEDAAHDDRHGDTHQKGRRHTLYRNKAGVAETVIKTDEAEQETGEQAVDGVGFEIIRAGENDTLVPGENAAEQIAVEEGQIEHHETESGG